MAPALTCGTLYLICRVTTEGLSCCIVGRLLKRVTNLMNTNWGREESSDRFKHVRELCGVEILWDIISLCQRDEACNVRTSQSLIRWVFDCLLYHFCRYFKNRVHIIALGFSGKVRVELI